MRTLRLCASIAVLGGQMYENAEPKVMRRTQSVILVIALLAVPLALLARGYACAPHQCAMMCCPAHKGGGHAMNMNCTGRGSAGSSACAMRYNSNKNIDYGLASPLPPTQLSAALSLPAPRTAETSFRGDYRDAIPGFSRIPFEPPRL
ncbi:MAG TPA: hypothetical protein VND42_01300 [Candidatus Acidoferrales bacterium]|nr:hypothetical protein [Candidatus Acidoferrales bacterium]